MVHAYSKILLVSDYLPALFKVCSLTIDVSNKARQNNLVFLMSAGRITSLLENFGAFPLALDLERRLQFGRTNEMDPDFGTGTCVSPGFRRLVTDNCRYSILALLEHRPCDWDSRAGWGVVCVGTHFPPLLCILTDIVWNQQRWGFSTYPVHLRQPHSHGVG